MVIMKTSEIYRQETGLEPYKFINYQDTDIDGVVDFVNMNIPTTEYLEWLEKNLEETYEPSILKWIKVMFSHAEKKRWFETYWSFDIHGTISKPDYRRDVKSIDYYPYAKETLQLLSEREDIIMIINTSSYPDELSIYQSEFKEDNINFNYVGENPEVQGEKGSFGYYKNKFYFNVECEDKSGFDPNRDWKFLYEYFTSTEYRPDPKWSMKYKEDYHNK